MPTTLGDRQGLFCFQADRCRLDRAKEMTMPKMKTHKGSKKRFRVTAKGKLKRRHAGKKHLLSSKTGKRKRHLRSIVIETDKMGKKYIHLMGGEA
jgi:large subunit ribosomal protein L35